MKVGNEQSVWAIHNRDEELFLRTNTVALGWKEVGNVKKDMYTRESLKERFIEVYPNKKRRSAPIASNMLYRFAYEVEVGDLVIFSTKSDRMIHIGRIESEYFYNDSEPEYRHVRKVKWLKTVPRDQFTVDGLHEIGSALSFFSVKKHVSEFLSVL